MIKQSSAVIFSLSLLLVVTFGTIPAFAESHDLEKQLDEIQKTYDETLAEFNIVEPQLTEAQYATLEMKLTVLNEQYDKIGKQLDDPTTPDDVIDKLYEQLDTFDAEYAKLYADLGFKYPELTEEQEKKLASLDAQYEAILVKMGDMSESDLKTTDTEPKTPTTAEFVFNWKQDASISGYEYSSHVNKPLDIEFSDKKITIPDNSYANKLQSTYGIILIDDTVKWNKDNAFALLETLKKIPQNTRDFYEPQSLPASKWVLTNDHIDDDIIITQKGLQKTVLISFDVFDNANPKFVEIDGKQGKYFSQKLHHALVQFVTDYGRDDVAVEKILKERYGVTTSVVSFEKLTEFTTTESVDSFQKFHPWELVAIINLFEEMPEGFHSIEGLNHVVRRADGMTHPLYPDAAAVSWTTDIGYIEFMDSAFTMDDTFAHRLILHEKTHFIWAKVFSDDLKSDWITLGGWQQDKSESGWSTTKTTKFVSDYAHGVNPDEDMSESLSYYITDPDKLKSRAVEKYEFIRDRIMHQSIYLSQIRSDLTFEIYNLNPDYVYPGKIIKVDIEVRGGENDDKEVTVQIELDSSKSFQGASDAYLRLFSSIGTFQDMYLEPMDVTGSILKGSIVIDKTAKNGYWYTNQIVVSDAQHNQRFEGQDDFGWKLLINNANEDLTSPKYVQDTLKLVTVKDLVKSIQTLTVSWQADDSQYIDCFARIANEALESYSMDKWGEYDEITKTCNVDYEITEYNRSGKYRVMEIFMIDLAGNEETVDFVELSKEYSITLTTTNQDIIAPYLDVNNIKIVAESKNPTSPNGETLVSITYSASDDKSGLHIVDYTVRDPQGIEHFDYHENIVFDTTPNKFNSYEIKFYLPEGSAAGTWGLVQINLVDNAHNQKSYEFTEIIHFNVE